MNSANTPDSFPRINVHVHDSLLNPEQISRLEAYLLQKQEPACLSLHPACVNALANGLKHKPYLVEATEQNQTRGFLVLNYLRSLLFGRFLVSLPYLNYGGVLAENQSIAELLINRAVQLADQLKVRYLELRHVQPIPHPALAHSRTDKVLMYLDLPATSEELWKKIPGKVRNQIRRGQKENFNVVWGGQELLSDFYSVFSQNMRDLGTPVFGRKLFTSILETFPDRAEFCVVRDDSTPAAAALLLHGWGLTEVPSASALRRYNTSCANMLLYWNLLERTVQRGQSIFDFGRSTLDSNTFRFKKQWGARPIPTEWQYYLRAGSLDAARRDNPKYDRFIRLWQKLPVSLTRWIGPAIVRCIP